MAQQLRTLAALPEDPGSVPRTQSKSGISQPQLTPIPGIPTSFYGLLVHMCMYHIHTHTHMHTCARTQSFFLFSRFIT